MKATIEFGIKRVIVPYNDRETVNHLMTQAEERYKKLLAKVVKIHKLETREGALLCGDDLLKDVIDDKEILGKHIKHHIAKVMACFLIFACDQPYQTNHGSSCLIVYFPSKLIIEFIC